MLLLDCHNHTDYSFDGHTPLFEMCDAANAAEFTVYTVTEHYDCESAAQNHCLDGVRGCYAQIDAYRHAHPAGTKILKGIELGQPLQNPDAAKLVFDELGDQMDFVIGSLHNVTGEKDFYSLDYHALGREFMEDLCERYYTELLAMSKTGGFDTVGHITYPFRYAVIRNFPLSYKPYDELVREMMKNIIEKGIAMEINTSGFRQGLGETIPGLYHLKMYRELGGELLTIGSDAHRISDFGRNIADGLLLAKEAGFSYITYFEQRKPVMVKL